MWKHTPGGTGKGTRVGKVSMGELARCASAKSAPLGKSLPLGECGDVPMRKVHPWGTSKGYPRGNVLMGELWLGTRTGKECNISPEVLSSPI